MGPRREITRALDLESTPQTRDWSAFSRECERGSSRRAPPARGPHSRKGETEGHQGEKGSGGSVGEGEEEDLGEIVCVGVVRMVGSTGSKTERWAGGRAATCGGWRCPAKATELERAREGERECHVDRMPPEAPASGLLADVREVPWWPTWQRRRARARRSAPLREKDAVFRLPSAPSPFGGFGRQTGESPPSILCFTPTLERRRAPC
jgi:hypothetical protein